MVAINQGFGSLTDYAWNPEHVDSHSFMPRKLHAVIHDIHFIIIFLLNDIIYILLKMFNTLVFYLPEIGDKKNGGRGTKLFFRPQVMLVNHSIFKSILKMLHLLPMMRNFQNLAHLDITSDACPISNLANNFEKLLHLTIIIKDITIALDFFSKI